MKNNLPQSRTEFLKKFVDLTIELHLEKSTNHALQRTDTVIMKQKLGQFSYEELRNNHMVFSLEAVSKVYPEITKNFGFGLLQITEHFTTDRKTWSFNFIHSSIREFLAAYYVQSLPDDKQFSLLRDTFWDERYLNTWTIYVGLTKGEGFAFKCFLSGKQKLARKTFKEFHISPKILQNKIMCLYLFQCFKEANNEAICKIVCESMEKKQVDLSHNPLFPNHVIILGFFLTNSCMEKLEKLDISNCNIQDFGLRDLWRALCSNGKSNVCINIMNLSGNQLSEICAGALADLAKCCETKELYVSNNKLGDVGAETLISGLPNNTKLKKLLMDRNEISAYTADNIDQRVGLFTSESLNIVGTSHLHFKNVSGDCIAEVLEYFSASCDLFKFSMHNCPAEAKHVEQILNLLVKYMNLETLRFSHISLWKSKIHFFVTTLSSLKHLSNFFLAEPSLCEAVVNCLISGLSVSNIVKMVIISDIKVHARQLHVEVENLEMNATTMKYVSKDEQFFGSVVTAIRVPLLKEINISQCKLGSIAIKKLANGIKCIQKLKLLTLSRNGIDDVAAEVIADSLVNKTFLEVLDLNTNKISSKGALAIAKSLTENTMLKVLDLHDNFINSDAAPGLSSMLNNKINLLEIKISKNALETKGMHDIVRGLQKVSSLIVLNVSANNIASSDIAAGIKNNTSLEILDVSQNKLESLGCIKLCKVLQKHHHNLKVFNISHNGINSIIAAHELASALKDKKKLEVVNVSQNEFEAGLAAIVASLKSTKFLKELTLRESGTVDQKAVIEICQIINQSPSLEVLDLGCTMLQTLGADKIFRTLSRNTTLKVLNVSYNYIEDTAVKQLASSSLAYYPTLSVLSLHNNPLSDSAIKDVFKHLLNAPSLKKIRVPNISSTRIKADIDQKVKTINRNRKDSDKLIFSNF